MKQDEVNWTVLKSFSCIAQGEAKDI